MADKYGPIFTVRFEVHKTLIVNSWDLGDCKGILPCERQSLCEPSKTHGLRGHGLQLWHDQLQSLRSLLASRAEDYIATLELLSNHRLEMLKHVRESEVKSAMKDTYDRWLQFEQEWREYRSSASVV
ncbi:hypothetical protein K1719_010405 [Acacia pycnantha]|nr:hypothetical protein K1719_010405 [Acacia pycnantha]